MTNDTTIEAFKEIVRDTDILIVTEPKSGQTWLMNFLYHLKTKGKSADFGGKGLLGAMPWIEIPFNPADMEPYKSEDRIKMFESIDNPRIFKMHVRWSKIPITTESKAKIITITRDPRDLPYSLYKHLTGLKHMIPNANVPWETFFEKSLKDKYFIQWMQSFWPHRNDTNLLWLRYEDMKLDMEGTAQKILDFTGWEASDEEVAKAIELSSFDHVKKTEKKNLFINLDNNPFREDAAFIREGKVGANREKLTEDMENRMMEQLRSELPEDAIEWLLSDPKDHN